jgi:uncharacterized protein YacL (UPF0231 family)
MDLKLFRDEDGMFRAEAGGDCQALGGYLEQDVQKDPEACRELLQQVEKVRKGAIEEWELTGNAYSLTLTRDKARIENLFSQSEKPCEMSLDDFEQAVSGWAELIASA